MKAHIANAESEGVRVGRLEHKVDTLAAELREMTTKKMDVLAREVRALTRLLGGEPEGAAPPHAAAAAASRSPSATLLSKRAGAPNGSVPAAESLSA